MRFWDELYPKLREDKPGIVGAMVARGSAMVLWIALIYALLDMKQVKGSLPKAFSVRLPHLNAAKAVWDYCCESAERLFASETGDKLCDKILELLGRGPMTRTDFNTHLSPQQKRGFNDKLEQLETWNLIRRTKQKATGAGRPSTVWELC